MTHYVEINANNMRQPTNLELAQLITLQSSLITYTTDWLRASNDLLADPEEVAKAEKLVQIVNASIGRFWNGIMLEGAEEKEI